MAPLIDGRQLLFLLAVMPHSISSSLSTQKDLFSSREIASSDVCQDEVDHLPAAGSGLLQVQTRRQMKRNDDDEGETLPLQPQDAASERAPSCGRKFACLEKQVSNIESDGVAVVIPGLGSQERILQVVKNIAWLKTQDVPFECWIFIYRSQQELNLGDKSRFSPCNLVWHPGEKWMAHVLAMPLNMTTKPWVLHMLDSIEPQSDVQLQQMQRIMRANSLGHLAPTFDLRQYPDPHYPSPYEIMARNLTANIGRFTDFVELHLSLFSRPYFACLQDNIDDNVLGWGIDRLLPGLCGGSIAGAEVEAGAIGLLDHMTMKKQGRGSYDYIQATEDMKKWVRRHNTIKITTYTNLGELKAPPLPEKAPAAPTEEELQLEEHELELTAQELEDMKVGDKKAEELVLLNSTLDELNTTEGAVALPNRTQS